MIIKLLYAPVLDASRTYFVEKILNELKKHTVRSSKYANLPFPVVAHHGYDRNSMKEVETDITGHEDLTIEYISEGDPLFKTHGYNPLVIIEGRVLDERQAITFALNDGFNSWSHFCKWFSEDCDKVILHFTGLRYGD